jgi:hypothetical protein
MNPKLLPLVIAPVLGFSLAIVVVAFDLGSTATLFAILGVAAVSAVVLVPLSFSQRPRRVSSYQTNGSFRTAEKEVDWSVGDEPEKPSATRRFSRRLRSGDVRHTS